MLITAGSALDTDGIISGSAYSLSCDYFTCQRGHHNPTLGNSESNCKVCEEGKTSSGGASVCADNHIVSTMTELWDKVSNSEESPAKAGANIMANGDTTTLSVGEYKCSDDGENCATSKSMLYTHLLYGRIECAKDDASCILNGESSRRGMWVYKTDFSILTVRSIKFYRGKASTEGGGGLHVERGKVYITLCVFHSCEAADSSGGGGIHVEKGTVNVYATAFTENTSSGGGKGNDIHKDDGTVTIHGTCPSPYIANTPKKG